MEELRAAINSQLTIDLIQIVISNQRKKHEVSKVKIRPVLIKEDLLFQASETVGQKELHTNYTKDNLLDKLEEWMTVYFKQLELTTVSTTMTALVSKKGKATIKHKNKENIRTQDIEHNRSKKYIIDEGTPVAFLVDLGVMTKEGKIVNSKYDKFKQINRFLEFIEDILPNLNKGKELTIIDFGCGKSYLTFAMYHYLKVLKGYDIKVIGLDLKDDVIKNCNELAVKYGFDKLNFYQGDIESYEGVEQVDMVVTLHACDTATDYAIYKAIKWEASVILSVPCCQHELNKQIHNDILAPIMEYGLMKERFAAIVTDTLRAKLLEMQGYRAQLLEFIDMEHTPKNVLIRGVKTGDKIDDWKEYEQCSSFLGVTPTLEKLLKSRDV